MASDHHIMLESCFRVPLLVKRVLQKAEVIRRLVRDDLNFHEAVADGYSHHHMRNVQTLLSAYIGVNVLDNLNTLPSYTRKIMV